MLSKAARRRTRSSEAARSTAAQAEVEREHTALAVQQQHSTAATTRWVRAGARQCGARRAAQGGETSSCISGTQAVLAAVSRHHLERMRRELRASREAGNGEEDEEADEVGVREWAEASHRGSSTRSARWRRRRRRAARRPPSSQRWLRCAMAWRVLARRYLHRVAASLAPRVVASGVAASRTWVCSVLGPALQARRSCEPASWTSRTRGSYSSAGAAAAVRWPSCAPLASMRSRWRVRPWPQWPTASDALPVLLRWRAGAAVAVARAATRSACCGSVRGGSAADKQHGTHTALAAARTGPTDRLKAAPLAQGCPFGPESERGPAARSMKIIRLDKWYSSIR